jgi:hypothetical protein
VADWRTWVRWGSEATTHSHGNASVAPGPARAIVHGRTRKTTRSLNYYAVCSQSWGEGAAADDYS